MKLRNVAFLAVATLGLFLTTRGTRAATLGLVDQPPYPDIDTGNTLPVTYTSGAFSVVPTKTPYLYSVALDSNAGDDDRLSGALFLTATINTTTGALEGGSINVTGALLSSTLTPLYTGTIISGTLTNFGYADPVGGAPIWEFTFNVTGGYFASQFGQEGGIILTMPSGAPDTFSYNKDYSGGAYLAVADVFPVPLPSAMLSGGLLLGTVACFGLLRARKIPAL